MPDIGFGQLVIYIDDSAPGVSEDADNFITNPFFFDIAIWKSPPTLI
jgi:hypothetical protein